MREFEEESCLGCDDDIMCDDCYESNKVYPESWGEIVLERALDNGEL